MAVSGPKGTNDLMPGSIEHWHYLESIIKEQMMCYGIKEIRTPIFEHTEVFLRGVGDTTDIVDKEMYTFLDKGDRSITLRPEGTASVARAFVEHHVYAEAFLLSITIWAYVSIFKASSRTISSISSIWN